MHLCVSLISKTLEQLQSDYDGAIAGGADLVELRLDYLEPAELKRITEIEPWLTSHAEQLIITCRLPDQGGHYQGNNNDRISLLTWAGGLKPRFVDFEHTCYLSSKDIQQKAGMMSSQESGNYLGNLILSEHHLWNRPTTLQRRFLDMCDTPAEAIKLVWRARDARDNFEAFDLLRPKNKPVSIFCSADDGLPSRVLGKKFGNLLTYCALRKGEETAPGQLTLEEMVQVYRWPTIDDNTDVYGLMGDPVAHSLSPHIHNAAFEHFGINAVYVPFRLENDGEVFAEFVSGVHRRSWLGVKGLSVTSPHKHHAWILTQEDLDPDLKLIGAINTLTFTHEGIWGNNTDYQAAINWISKALGCDWSKLAKRKIDILGAGGLARTLADALRSAQAEVCIHNRTLQKAQQLADEFDCKADSLDGQTKLNGDVLINCTSVGMQPEIGESPLKPEQIIPKSTVFDAIYNPLKTQLLKDAESRGCNLFDGLDMFIEQAAMQFEIWTGIKDTELRPVMRKAALAQLRKID